MTAAAVAAGAVRVGSVAVDGGDVLWLEGRPAEGGRQALVRWRDGRRADVLPAEANVRTRVHEYGGGAYAAAGGLVCYCNLADGRLHRAAPGGVPVPVTPDGPWHYADLRIDAPRGRVVCVREDRSRPGVEPVNTLVSVPLDGGGGPGVVLAGGEDFYAAPALSGDGARLCWLSWRHPRMPWDGTDLWVAEVGPDGGVREVRHVAGGPEESIYQPGWTGDGALVFASDRTGWWTLYRWDGGAVRPVLDPAPAEAEFGRPAWVFGTATWADAGRGRLVVAWTAEGRWRLGVAADGRLTPLAPGLQPLEWLAATPGHAVLAAGSSDAPDRVVRVPLDGGDVETLSATDEPPLPAAAVSRPESVWVPTAGGRAAHAFYYPPASATCAPPAGEAPPLLVLSHGGPSAAAQSTFSLPVQFWTSRGFAVVDVNYGGSTGFGRAYRARLDGTWGVVDVEDCIAAARHLAATGRADPSRLLIRGGSAGGFTTLCALVFHPGVFRAGASYYGISDLEVLARDTHKFEARYTDRLVGPYPAARGLYHDRSPRYAVDRLACPIILFQGLEDLVVPPNQAELMAGAVRAKGLPVAHLTFPGEGHGFRRAETIRACLEAELYFYGKVCGFTPADALPAVPIANL